MPEFYSKDMPCTWAALREVVLDVRSWLSGLGASDRAQYVAEVVLEEMLANAVEHGAGGEVAVRAVVGPRRIALRFEDTGPAFDPCSQPPRFPVRDGGGSGGLGLHHVRSLAGGMRYQLIEGRNVVSVTVDRWRETPVDRPSEGSPGQGISRT